MKLDPLRLLVFALILLFSLLILFEWGAWILSANKESSIIERSVPLAINKKESINDLLNTPLFGVYVPDDERSIKKSVLNVTLVGILLADKKEESQVIIRGPSGIEKNYKIGDELPGGALIKRINKDGLLVEREGALERISLPKTNLEFEPLSKPLKKEESP